MCARLRAMTGDETLSIGHAYGRHRLESHGGAFDISPRLPAGELFEWMYAYAQGIGAIERASERAATMEWLEPRREESR